MILACASLLSTALTFPIRAFATLLSRTARSPKVKLFFLERTEEHFNGQLLHAKNIKNHKIQTHVQATFWLHVSSAGELEQVIPVMRSLHSRLSVHFFVTYFSPSTKPFLKNCPGVIGSVCLPAEDRTTYSKIFTQLHIKRLLLVRYDFWPALIHTAQQHNVPIAVLAATLKRARSPLPQTLQTITRLFWFKQADLIFLVSEDDKNQLVEFGFSPKTALVSGDAKWARARERAQNQKLQLNPTSIQTVLSQTLETGFLEKAKTLVFGSPHEDETGVLKKCLEEFTNPCLFIVAPAEVDEQSLTAIERQLSCPQADILRLSSLENSVHKPSTVAPRQHIVIIMDCFGKLAEAYERADCAIVGGGFDGQLHNVLEPAAYPVLTLFGNRVSRAPEAQILLNHNAAVGFANPNDLFDFLQRWSSLKLSGNGESSVCSNFEHTLEAARTLFSSLPDTSEVICRAIAQQDKLEFT